MGIFKKQSVNWIISLIERFIHDLHNNIVELDEILRRVDDALWGIKFEAVGDESVNEIGKEDRAKFVGFEFLIQLLILLSFARFLGIVDEASAEFN